jgi:NADPH2:quinone reductase
MKAIVCDRYCEPEDLRLGDLPEPELGDDEVLIDVHAAALNFPDLLMIQGKYQYKSDFPFAPGVECAGTVARVGANVTSLEPGQRVAAHPWRHCLAEKVTAPHHEVFAIPDNMDFITAAGFPIVYGTVYHALADRGRLAAGETLLVLGAAGGVGLAAVEMGKRMGATVIAAAGGTDKLDLCRTYGADHLVDYRQGRLRDHVRDLTDGKGADVIFDPVGGDMTDESVRCVNWRGRILIVGFAAGRIASVPANLPLMKGAEIIGVAYHRFFIMEPERGHANMTELLKWQEQGAFRPHHSMVLPLAETPAALRAMAERRSTGKIVLTVR